MYERKIDVLTANGCPASDLALEALDITMAGKILIIVSLLPTVCPSAVITLCSKGK
jgi:hypothetical protein